MVNIEIAVGLLLFVLAFSYALLDIPHFFRKEAQESEQVSFWKYGFFYVAGYFQILLKAFLALLFVFVFFMVYNIILVGVFKPLISDSISEGKGAYEDVVAKAKEGYFSAISAMAKITVSTVFVVVDVKLALLLLFAYLPITVFVVAIVYHSTVARKKNMEGAFDANVARTTNYHFLTMTSLSFIIMTLCFIVIAGLHDNNNQAR
jgi:hypothetical protein